MKHMTGAQAIVESLLQHDVKTVFGIPGGAILPLYDALYDAPIDHVLTRHEQAAALAADGYARMTGQPGVCLATSGPGATNLVTGIANAYMDSVPVIAITGNVPQSAIGTDAFQEIDIFGMCLGITKHSYVVRDADDLPHVMREAFLIATSGRPGPVLIDVPRDVLMTHVSPDAWRARPTVAVDLPKAPDPRRIEEAAGYIARAQRPVIYAGGGVITAGASEALRRFAERANVPVTTTVMGLGAIPGDHPLFLGMLGMHGNYAANMALTETDCLVAVGARFDDRVTGKVAEFAPHATIVHIDVDASEQGKIKLAKVPIVADAKLGLEALAEAHAGRTAPDRSAWFERINRWKTEHPYSYDRDSQDLLPQAVIEALDRCTGGQAVITTGVGQHQMWTAMFYKFRRPRQLLTSGGLGAMGYGLPAAIGAVLGDPSQPVVCVDGDASFQINMQELAVVAERRLPIKIVIINNRAHGMVRQQQHLWFQQRYAQSIFDGEPDFVKLADAFNIPAQRIDRPQELDDAIAALLKQEGPALLECVVRQDELVLPIVPPGAALKGMVLAK